MKKIYATLLIIVLGFVLGYLIHWIFSWVVVVAVIWGFRLNAIDSFLSGFMALFLLWGLYALTLDIQNESILSTRIGQLLAGLSSTVLILTTALLGAIGGGLVGWSSSALLGKC